MSEIDKRAAAKLAYDQCRLASEDLAALFERWGNIDARGEDRVRWAVRLSAISAALEDLAAEMVSQPGDSCETMLKVGRYGGRRLGRALCSVMERNW